MFDNLIYLYRHAMNLMEGPSDGEPSSFDACREAYHTNDNRVGVSVGNNHHRMRPARQGWQACD